MKQVQWFYAFGVAAIMSMSGLGWAAQSGDRTAIFQELNAQIIVTRTAADRSDIVNAGSVVELRKEGVLMYGVASPLPPSNTYKNGKISQGWGGFGKDLLITLLAPGNGTSANYPARKFVAGEACWVTGISVQKDGVVFQLYSDPYDGIHYYADLKIPFPQKKVVPPVDAVLQMVAEVLETRRSETPGGEQVPGSARGDERVSEPSQGGEGSDEKPLSVDDILKATSGGSVAEPSSEPGTKAPGISRLTPPGSKPFTNKDVLALVKAGLGAEAIVAKIKQASNVTFDVSTDALIALRQKKVRSSVIAAMVEREGRESSRISPRNEVAAAASVDPAPGGGASFAEAIPAAAKPVSRMETPSENSRLERVIPFRTWESTHLGIVEQLVTIDSVAVTDWPRPEKLVKAEGRPDETTHLTVKFTYANRNKKNWKCQYSVAILDDKGKEIGSGLRDASLGGGETADTNRVSVKMRTLDFPRAAKLSVRVRPRPG